MNVRGYFNPSRGIKFVVNPTEVVTLLSVAGETKGPPDHMVADTPAHDRLLSLLRSMSWFIGAADIERGTVTARCFKIRHLIVSILANPKPPVIRTDCIDLNILLGRLSQAHIPFTVEFLRSSYSNAAMVEIILEQRK